MGTRWLIMFATKSIPFFCFVHGEFNLKKKLKHVLSFLLICGCCKRYTCQRICSSWRLVVMLMFFHWIIVCLILINMYFMYVQSKSYNSLKRFIFIIQSNEVFELINYLCDGIPINLISWSKHISASYWYYQLISETNCLNFNGLWFGDIRFHHTKGTKIDHWWAFTNHCTVQ